MKKTFLAIATLISTSAFAYDPQFSMEVAVCKGKLGEEQKEITIYRDRNDKSKASVLYKTVDEKGSTLFTGAIAQRVGNTLETKHEKMSITIDLASEKADKSMSGKWDNQVSLTCKLVYPYID
jgi:hypothetical protein